MLLNKETEPNQLIYLDAWEKVSQENIEQAVLHFCLAIIFLLSLRTRILRFCFRGAVEYTDS